MLLYRDGGAVLIRLFLISIILCLPIEIAGIRYEFNAGKGSDRSIASEPFTGENSNDYPMNEMEAEIYAQAGCKKIETIPLTLPLITERQWYGLYKLWPSNSVARKNYDQILSSSLPTEEKAQKEDAIISRRYGLRYDPDSEPKLVGLLKKDGNLYPNCFLCHAASGGPEGGTNDRLLFQQLKVDAAKAKLFGENPKSVIELEEGRIAQDLYLESGDKFSIGPGITQSYDIFYKLLQTRDKNFNSDLRPEHAFEAVKAFLDPDLKIPKVPSKAPVWWNYRFEKTAFTTAQVSKDHLSPDKTTDGRMLMHFLLAADPTISGKDLRAMDDLFRQILACVKSIPVPPTRALFEKDDFSRKDAPGFRGQEIFEVNCSGCHGRAKNGVIQYRDPGGVDVGTDDTLIRFMTDYQIPLSKGDWDTESLSGSFKPFVQSSGYRPPPLAGIGYRPQLLHNGSVGTIIDLLTPPSQRPKVWSPIFQGPGQRNPFDQESVRHITEDQYKMMTVEQASRCIDTTAPGLSNQGHPFGTNLSAQDKESLMYFLERQTTVPGEPLDPSFVQ
jgi:hypothetical protein